MPHVRVAGGGSKAGASHCCSFLRPGFHLLGKPSPVLHQRTVREAGERRSSSPKVIGTRGFEPVLLSSQDHCHPHVERWGGVHFISFKSQDEKNHSPKHPFFFLFLIITVIRPGALCWKEHGLWTQTWVLVPASCVRLGKLLSLSELWLPLK